jgi:hypothetical protein
LGNDAKAAFERLCSFPGKSFSMSNEPQTVNRVRESVRKTIERPFEFDYGAPAELFPCRIKNGHGQFKYRRFETAAEAIRFAVEDVPAPALRGAYLEVDEARFACHEIHCLYDSAAYPLRRTGLTGIGGSL